MSPPLIKYVLMAAVRDRLILSMASLFILGACLSLFLGSAAVIEKDQFSVIFSAGGLRLIGVSGLVLFIVFFIRRSFDGKEVEFLLSRPISRINLLLSLSMAFSILALILGAAIGLCVFAMGPHLFSYGHLLWVLSIVVENIIMVNVTLFFAMQISIASTAAIITFSFYVLARMMGQLLGIVDSTLVNDTGPEAVVVQFVSVFMPRLDLMGQTSWLIYGLDGAFSFWFVAAQGIVFCLLIILAALFDFVRRQF